MHLEYMLRDEVLVCDCLSISELFIKLFEIRSLLFHIGNPNFVVVTTMDTHYKVMSCRTLLSVLEKLGMRN